MTMETSPTDQALKELERNGMLGKLVDKIREVVSEDQFFQILVQNKVDFEVILQVSRTDQEKEQIVSLPEEVSSSQELGGTEPQTKAFALASAAGPGWGVSTSRVCRVVNGQQQC